jgi:hypothetical protein
MKKTETKKVGYGARETKFRRHFLLLAYDDEEGKSRNI